MRTIDPAIERVWELMRHNHADIINQSLPAHVLELLDSLEQKERALDSAVKAGEVGRLKASSNDGNRGGNDWARVQRTTTAKQEQCGKRKK